MRGEMVSAGEQYVLRPWGGEAHDLVKGVKEGLVLREPEEMGRRTGRGGALRAQ